ncbi:MAG: hypothetical protein JXR40_05500 [Pontiellaceae bacterium]|nr:hypothetical protein [Pontiellaceae bacterium]
MNAIEFVLKDKMKQLIIISSILIGHSASVFAQEKQNELPLPYSQLSLEERSYVVTGKGDKMTSLSSYTLFSKDGVEYILPKKDKYRHVFSVLENLAISEQVYRKSLSFDQWMDQYEGTFLSSAPLDFTEEWEYNYSSPLNALHSYWHALYNCDAETILRCSDSSFRIYLERNKKWNLLASPPVFNSDGQTKIVPLLTGECVIGGKKYTVIFYRRECPENPKSNRISFHWEYFVFLDGTYYQTYAPAGSQFGSMDKVMNLGTLSQTYENFVDILKETSMPKEFYMLMD